jgi:UDPglucose--hexose-1-phosphate uridylyltransferase
VSAPELRIDQLTGMRTLLAPDRAGRPDDYAAARPASADREGSEGCPFCEGKEDETPPEVWANRPGGGGADSPGWLQRSVPNLYPALVGPDAAGESASVSESGLTSAADPLLASARSAEPELFKSMAAAGGHEVIVNSPRHVASLGELAPDELAGALVAWRTRIAAHADEASLVHLIVNEGPDAGATLEHTHAQLFALPFVPPEIARERERFTAYNQRTMGGHLLEDVMVEEVRRRDRLVAIDDEAALFCPWASRWPYEMRLVPRTPTARFDADERGAALLHRALRALAERLGEGVQLNLWVRTAPRDTEEFHWHIDLVPRLGTRGGFELGTGVDINVMPPERAAGELREALSDQRLPPSPPR